MVAKKKNISKADKLKLNAKDIGVRALKTFVQTLIGSLAVVAVATSWEAQKVALIGALASSVAASLSVIQNALLAVVDK